MEGDKFNLTPVDFVSKGIVHTALNPAWSKRAGTAIHPSISNNTVTMVTVVEVLEEMGYTDLRWMDFVQWRGRILAKPAQYKSWSFIAELTDEGNGLDSMADNKLGLRAIKEAVGEDAVASFDARDCLRRMIRSCQEKGTLPMPVARVCTTASSSRDAAQPLLEAVVPRDLEAQT